MVHFPPGRQSIDIQQNLHMLEKVFIVTGVNFNIEFLKAVYLIHSFDCCLTFCHPLLTQFLHIICLLLIAVL